MTDTAQLNLLDIENLLKDFLIAYDKGICTLYRVHCPGSDKLALQAFIEDIMDELRAGCVSFVNDNDSLDGLNQYLFYIVNANAKKMATQKIKKVTQYVCPGCLFLGKKNIITLVGSTFKCNECNASIKETTDPKKISLLKTFIVHNKIGYKCPDCNRFIPRPLYGNIKNVTCPYFDCCFVGDIDVLKKMHHPSLHTNSEKLVADLSGFQQTSQQSADNKLEAKEILLNSIKMVTSIIDSQIISVPYSGSNFTLIHKVLAYQAIKNLLQKHPEEMIDYLINNSRSGGFQHKIFQEYIKLLEESLPYCYKKGNDIYRVESLLDPNLNLFDGISVFEATISDKLEIKNNTKEFYIGGRKASYSKPYYIGKLLSVIDKKTKSPLISHVKEYSFSKIKMRDIVPGTEVIVTHLRIPPHYQMGGMVYINRLRKKITDRAKNILSGKDE